MIWPNGVCWLLLYMLILFLGHSKIEKISNNNILFINKGKKKYVKWKNNYIDNEHIESLVV